MMRTIGVMIAATALLAGCAGRSSAPTRPVQDNRPPVGPGAVVQPMQSGSLIGRTAAALIAAFGPAALDVIEGSARKLQFSTNGCVLDAYLYPRPSGEAQVTHVDARLPDGRDTDREACAEALRRR